MSAALTDKFKKVGSAGTLTAMSAPGKAMGASSFNVSSGANYPTDTAFIVAVRTVDADGVEVDNTYTEWIGIISGTTITINPTPVYGADQVYAAGSTTQVFIVLSATRDNDLVGGILIDHKQDGHHGDSVHDSVSTDTISEKTSAHGVTVDSLNIKDGKLNTNNSVVTANLTNASVTPDKLATGANSGVTAGSENTASATYADLSGGATGPAAAVTIGANGMALVIIGCGHSNSVQDNGGYMGFAISGATTVAASDTFAVMTRTNVANFGDIMGRAFLVTGLTPGSNTFTAKYRTDANTESFSNRRIAVIPL